MKRLSIVCLRTYQNKLADFCRRTLISSLNEDCVDFNIVPLLQHRTVPRSSRNCVINMLAALNLCEDGPCFICDDDCLYPPGYFQRELVEDGFNYARPAYYLLHDTYSRRFKSATSSLAGYRDVLRDGLWSVVRSPSFQQRGSRAEPMQHNGSPVFHQEIGTPYLDIRHKGNHTGGKRRYDNPKRAPKVLPYWGAASALWERVHAG